MPNHSRVLFFVLSGEALEVFFEQKLDRIDPALLVNPLLDRSELKGKLSCHNGINAAVYTMLL